MIGGKVGSMCELDLFYQIFSSFWIIQNKVTNWVCCVTIRKEVEYMRSYIIRVNWGMQKLTYKQKYVMGIKKKYKGNEGYGKSSLEILYVYIRILKKEKLKIKIIIKKHI